MIDVALFFKEVGPWVREHWMKGVILFMGTFVALMMQYEASEVKFTIRQHIKEYGKLLCYSVVGSILFVNVIGYFDESSRAVYWSMVLSVVFAKGILDLGWKLVVVAFNVTVRRISGK